ncbi:25013_t:CDS:2, partial [Gigaspora rosea]
NQEEEVEKAQCLFEGCDTEYLWSGSTSNLITHLRDTHHVTKESLAEKPVKVHQQMIQQVLMKPHSSYVQKKLTHQVAHYIVSRAQPIHLVEVDDFKLLLKGFDSHFKMPCISDTVSLTLDIWSSRAHNSYLGITCHWLTDLFELHEVVLEFGELDDHCTTDIVESVNLKKRKQLRKASFQIAPGLKEPLDVIKDVDTRWNSTFYSIKHLVHLRQLYSTLNNHTLRE